MATPLPNSEVVYLTSLPRRVDEVLIKIGEVLDGPLLQVSGATLQVKVTVSEDEAALLTAGMTAQLTVPGDRGRRRHHQQRGHRAAHGRRGRRDPARGHPRPRSS